MKPKLVCHLIILLSGEHGGHSSSGEVLHPMHSNLVYLRTSTGTEPESAVGILTAGTSNVIAKVQNNAVTMFRRSKEGHLYGRETLVPVRGRLATEI